MAAAVHISACGSVSGKAHLARGRRREGVEVDRPQDADVCQPWAAAASSTCRYFPGRAGIGHEPRLATFGVMAAPRSGNGRLGAAGKEVGGLHLGERVLERLEDESRSASVWAVVRNQQRPSQMCTPRSRIIA